MRGINKQAALDYTFVLGIPSILAAAVLEIKDVDKAMLTTDNIIAVAFGVIAAAVVGYFSIVLFKWLLKTDKMIVFIIYTAVVGLIVTGISVFEILNNTTVKFF